MSKSHVPYHCLCFTNSLSLSLGISVLLFRTKTSKFSEPKIEVSESTLGVLIRRATSVSNSMDLGLHVPVEEMALHKGHIYMHQHMYMYECVIIV